MMPSDVNWMVFMWFRFDVCIAAKIRGQREQSNSYFDRLRDRKKTNGSLQHFPICFQSMFTNHRGAWV